MRISNLGSFLARFLLDAAVRGVGPTVGEEAGEGRGGGGEGRGGGGKEEDEYARQFMG